MAKKTQIAEFIEKAKKIHREKYDYSETSYINSLNKITFKCIKHNLMVEMLPGNHLAGKGCRKCAYESSRLKNAKTKEDFIKESQEIHNNKYNYDLVEYINARTKVTIICPIHGNFEQIPDSHLRSKGCCKCNYERMRIINTYTIDQFIERSNKIHDNKYDYSKFKYKNDRGKSIIICPIHGEFLQCPGDHYKSKGCGLCGNLNTSKYQRENPNGWSYKTWIKKAENSKYFDSFKLYIIKCWNENEIFYKIGRTYTTVRYRFRFKTQLPYKYKILKEIIGDPQEIVNLELKLKKEHTDYKYIPNEKFDGMHECYKQIIYNNEKYI